ADVRSRHAGPGFRTPVVSRHSRLDPLSRCDEIGLQTAITGRTAAGEKADPIGVRPVAMRRADGDDSLSVSGIGNTEGGVAFENPLLGFEFLMATVAGRRDHDNAILHQPFTLDAHGRLSARIIANIMGNRQAEISAVDGDIAVPLVDVSDV